MKDGLRGCGRAPGVDVSVSGGLPCWFWGCHIYVEWGMWCGWMSFGTWDLLSENDIFWYMMGSTSTLTKLLF